MISNQCIIDQGNIYIEITSVCNLRCTYCYNDSKINGNELPFEKIKEIMKYYNSLGINNITVSGGEPFLYLILFKILK